MPPDPLDRLPIDAVRHLAHEMRGALHTILGHSQLLTVEAHDSNTRESADHIYASAAKLAAWVDDVIDLLRLPGVAEKGEVRLDVRTVLAAVRAAVLPGGVHVVFAEPAEPGATIVVDQSVERLVRRVFETVLATAKADLEFRQEPYRAGDVVAVVCVSPVPESTSDLDNGVLAIAARVFAARSGGIVRTGERLWVRVPTRQRVSS